jgi:iron complex outermembrane receptor protein
VGSTEVWRGRLVDARAGIFVICLVTSGVVFQVDEARSAPVDLPSIHIKPAKAKKPRTHRPHTAIIPVVPPAAKLPTPDEVRAAAFSGNATTPLGFPASLDKTGTPVGDVPRSIQIVPHELFERQGATMVGEALRDVSGVGLGGQFAFGFYDRFFIRGMNANFLSDGLPDSTSDLTGIPHTLTGVERIEVLKGPGSALYGSSQPGGTINIVHFLPSSIPSASISERFSSFGTTTTDVAATGPTTLANLDWRVDGRFENSNGFRAQHDQIAEFLPTVRWQPPAHDMVVRFELRHLDLTPDAAGIPFSPPKGTGLPLAVPTGFTYYTPFARGDQDIARLFGSDAWTEQRADRQHQSVIHQQNRRHLA